MSSISIILFLLACLFFWFLKNIKIYGPLWIAKGSLLIGILVLFIAGFFKLLFALPSNPYIKIIFFMTYIWCTVGINVNFIIPLIGIIDQKIEK